ncbi:MAG: hypothetical protein GXW99_00310 [Clostridiales bacterium]|nr:hypothetical protein [Clostridiales bacterium]
MPVIIDYMIPITAFFLLRFGMCFRDLSHARKKREQTGVLRPVKSIYREMGSWLGAALGGILVVIFHNPPSLYFFIAVAFVLVCAGRLFGSRYGAEQDAILEMAEDELKRIEEDSAFSPEAADNI